MLEWYMARLPLHSILQRLPYSSIVVVSRGVTQSQLDGFLDDYGITAFGWERSRRSRVPSLW